MKKRLTIMLIPIIFIILLMLIFICKPRFILEFRDSLYNTKAYIDVKVSKEYKEMSNDKGLYYKDEKNLKIPILLYHEITENTPERNLYPMQTSKFQFEKQIKGLLDNGYTVIDYDDLIEYKNGNKRLPTKIVIICFDDGYIGNYKYAFEICKKYEIPINIFVIDDLVGTSNYFSWEQAKQMYETGLVNVYSHGRTHISYAEKDIDTFISDVTSAHSNIEKHLEKSITKVFTYPNGSYRQEQLEELKELGFVQNLTDNLINESNILDMYGLHRIYVLNSYSEYSIINLISEI